MKKFTFVVLMIALSFISAFGQNAVENDSQCTNQTVEKISSRGISLGMSQEETLNLFAENGKLTVVSYAYLQGEGQTKFSTSEIDYQLLLNNLQNRSARNFGFSIITLAPKDAMKFNGISRYDLGFLDNRLAFFTVYYLKPKWKNHEQFVSKLTETLNLPKPDQIDGNSTFIKCGDYTVRFGEYVNDDARYALSVSANIDEIVGQRGKKAEDEQREKDIKTFEP
ncbi:MAG: hypothetical protein LH614_07390 [Pyrinomonadaceae bacterium]|nr:hypothetical protein [Pyrinomonadaceae bacterium]